MLPKSVSHVQLEGEREREVGENDVEREREERGWGVV